MFAFGDRTASCDGKSLDSFSFFSCSVCNVTIRIRSHNRYTVQYLNNLSLLYYTGRLQVSVGANKRQLLEIIALIIMQSIID